MSIILDNENVFEYLADLKYCQLDDRDRSEVTFISAKNFNLLIQLPDQRFLLVKQEIQDGQGQTAGEFWSAWQMHQLVKKFPDLQQEIGDYLQEILHFDPDNSILVVKFLADRQDLSRYYRLEQDFNPMIARQIGSLLGKLHSQTFQKSAYQKFLLDRPDRQTPISAIDIIRRMSRIYPGVFAMMPKECLQFFKLYQRFPILPQAIAKLGTSIRPCCLVHNDVKLNNFLIHVDWQKKESNIISLIDWERVDWGDPAYDLGCLIGSYLELWLEGLTIGNELSIQESLQLAVTPLELLQPSLFTLMQTYLEQFLMITSIRSDYLDRVVQFAGLSLIQRIEIFIEDERVFGNRGIIILQVAKQLLCSPQAAITTIFGTEGTQLSR
jgi:thiamine kinase-like enzyme